MSGEYQSFDLIWQDRRIAVSFQDLWLNSGHWHIELRCEQRLPLTTTGYRSCFVPCTEDADKAEVTELVLHWLNEAAESKEWQRYLEDSRQLNLFDQ